MAPAGSSKTSPCQCRTSAERERQGTEHRIVRIFDRHLVEADLLACAGARPPRRAPAPGAGRRGRRRASASRRTALGQPLALGRQPGVAVGSSTFIGPPIASTPAISARRRQPCPRAARRRTWKPRQASSMPVRASQGTCWRPAAWVGGQAHRGRLAGGTAGRHRRRCASAPSWPGGSPRGARRRGRLGPRRLGDRRPRVGAAAVGGFAIGRLSVRPPRRSARRRFEKRRRSRSWSIDDLDDRQADRPRGPARELRPPSAVAEACRARLGAASGPQTRAGGSGARRSPGPLARSVARRAAAHRSLAAPAGAPPARYPRPRLLPGLPRAARLASPARAVARHRGGLEPEHRQGPARGELGQGHRLHRLPRRRPRSTPTSARRAPTASPTRSSAPAPAQLPIHYTAYGSESSPGPFPVPAGAPVEGGAGSDGDRHVLVVDTLHLQALRALPRLLQAKPKPHWDADAGVEWDLRSAALRPDGWTSADAAGLPIFPGLVRYEEAAAGHVDHAIRVTMDSTRNAWIHPASHCAGDTDRGAAPPMGLRLRLKAGYGARRHGHGRARDRAWR